MSLRSIIKKMFFLLSRGLFFLLLVEIGLQIMMPIYDSKMLHDKQNGDKKTFRIYCFGDSFTFGDGASPKDSYPRQLERVLNARSGMDYEVYNLGIPGGNSSQVSKYFHKILLKYKNPDLIIIRVGVNDCWNFSDHDFLSVDRDKKRSRSKPFFFLSKLKLYCLAKEAVSILKTDDGYIPFGRDNDNPQYKKMDDAKFKEIAEFNLEEMVKFAKLRKIPLVLQNYPGGDIYGPTTISGIAERYSVPMVDISSTFKEEMRHVEREDIFAPYWGASHPNASGYQIMTEEIYRVMVREGLVNDLRASGG